MIYGKYLTVATVLVLLSFPVYGFNNNPNYSIYLHYSFDAPIIHHYDDGVHIEINGLKSTGDGGKPIVPVKPLYILLPQGKEVKDVEVLCNNKVTMDDKHILSIAQNPSIFGNSNEIEVKTFDSSKPFPVDGYHIEGVYGMRGYDILVMNVYPLHYVKDTGELYYFKDVSERAKEIV